MAAAGDGQLPPLNGQPPLIGQPPPPPLNAAAPDFAPGNAQPNNNRGDMLAAATVQVNLPPFWLRSVTWFNLCESTFATRNITSTVTKYHYCVGKIPAETIDSIEDLVNDFASFNDPYEELKSRLTRAYGKTLQEKIDDLLDREAIGSHGLHARLVARCCH